MTNKEIKQKRKELTEILRIEPPAARLGELQKLAKAVGASIVKMGTNQRDGCVINISQNIITEIEIVHNIEQAFHTHSMINTAKSAQLSWVIAAIAASISLLSVIAAWTAVLYKN